MSDTAREFVMAFLQSLAMDETADYLQRGREFQANTIEELEAAYAEVYKLFVRAIVDHGGAAARKSIQAADDIAAELRLRGLGPPIESVRDAMAELEKFVRTQLPERLPAVEEKLDDFLAEWVTGH
jgi:uncharacterized protein YaaN involved in tellurite resistance